MKASNGRSRVLVPVNETTTLNERSNRVAFSEMYFDLLSRRFVIFTREVIDGKLVEREARLSAPEVADAPDLTRESPTREISLPIADSRGKLTNRKGTITLLVGTPEVYTIRVGRIHMITRRHSNGWQLALAAAAVATFVVFGIGVGVGLAIASDGIDVDIDRDDDGNIIGFDIDFDDEEDEEDNSGS